MLKEFDSIFQMLEAHSGLTVSSVHRQYMEKLILERTASMGVTSSEYCELVRRDDAELSYLTNAAAVNETYFFREEKQFDFLKNEIFIPSKTPKLSIWSVSCSTGEEPLSIYTLAKDCGLTPSIYASDIDTDVLATFRTGIYSKNSFRADGEKYRPLIEKNGVWDGDKLTLSRDLISNIHIFTYNLVSQDPPPIPDGSIDIIFMRNVFIYFSQEVRRKILTKMAKSLKEDGILLLSINEVGNIDRKGIPFEKLHTDTVYYLKKSSLRTEKKASPSAPCPERPKIILPAKSVPAPRTPLPANGSTTADASTKKSRASAPNSESIQEFYVRLNKLIENDELEAARKILSEKNFMPHEMEFKYFFSALIYADEEDESNAKEHLEKAMMLNKAFWPASYRLAVMQYKNGETEKAKASFEECGRTISEYVEAGKKDYDFLTEQFCPEYFKVLCEGYLKHMMEG